MARIDCWSMTTEQKIQDLLTIREKLAERIRAIDEEIVELRQYELEAQ